MKKSLKGALLSGLIFPGAGQLWLKHRIRGLALIVAVTVSLAVIVIKSVQQALAILEKIESEGGAVDLVAILNSASQASATSDDFIIKSATMVLIAGWVLSIIDAYLLGRKKDLADQAREQASKRRDISDPD
jgi:TM2 domain-containing membrane protein YozV